MTLLPVLGDTVLAIGSLVLLIGTVVTASSDVATAVYVLNLLIAFPALLSLAVKIRFNRSSSQQQGDRDSALLNNNASQKKKTHSIDKLKSGLSLNLAAVMLVFAPSVSLFCVLILRLFLGEDAFEGYASLLDYGWKYGIEGGDPNVAFEAEFNSYGHCIQGVLCAWFAFPAVSGLITQLLTCKCWKQQFWMECNETIQSLIIFTSWALTIYPTYNLIKRVNKAGEAFAGSSFANNGLEWAYGFMIGIALGSFVTSLVITTAYRKVSSSFNKAWVLPPPTTQETPGRWRVCVQYVQLLFGILLLISVFAASVMFGQTWHNCLEGGDECVNYSEESVPVSIQVAFVAIPAILIPAAAVRECCFKSREKVTASEV